MLISIKNESAYAMHELLLKQGIKNNDFMLQNTEKTPMYTKITEDDYFIPMDILEEDIEYVIEKAKEDFFYFVRELARIPVIGDNMPVRFNMNQGHMAMWYVANKGYHTITALPRMQAATMSHLVYLIWKLIRQKEDEYITIIAPNYSTARDFRERMYRMIQYLPHELRCSDEYFDNHVKLPSFKCMDDAVKCGKEIRKGIVYLHDIDDIKYVDRLLGSAVLTNRTYPGHTQFMMSCISNNRDDSRESLFIDRTIFNAYTWFNELYDLPNLPNHSYYIRFPYNELITGDNEAKKWFDEQSRMLQNDQDKINKTIRMQRY